MSGEGANGLPGERIRWPVPLMLAVAGLIGSVVSAQLAAAAIDDRLTDDEPPALEGGRIAAEPAAATTSSTEAPEPETIAPATEEDAAEEPAEEEAAEPVDCPPLFEVLFPLGGDKPLTDLGTKPEELAVWLTAHPDAELLIEGHADAEGSEGVNLQLSFRRAEATAAMIIEAGAAADRIQPRGFGEYQPIAGVPPDSDRNRRVTMHVPGRDECPIDNEEATE